MSDFLEQLARENNGAIEVDEPTGRPLFVVLAGPIKVWWEPGKWDSPLHKAYVKHRDATEAFLVERGILVYKPHTAWRGAWHEAAQKVNDLAVAEADALVVLTPQDGPYGARQWAVSCAGTLHEMAVAKRNGTRVVLHPVEEADPELQFAYLLDALTTYFPDREFRTA